MVAGWLNLGPTMVAIASHLEERYFHDGCMGLCEFMEMAP